MDISKLLTGELDRIPGAGVGGGRDLYFFVAGNLAAIRSGKWKYVRPGFRDSIQLLYDLEADPGETNSLRRFNLDIVNQLEKKIAQFK